MYLNFPYLVTLTFAQFWEILLSDKLSIFAYEKKKRLCTYECQASGSGSFLFKKPLMFFFFFFFKLKKRP